MPALATTTLEQSMTMDSRKVQKIIARYDGELTYNCYLEIKEVSEIDDKTIRKYFGISGVMFQAFKNAHEKVLGTAHIIGKV